MLFQFKTETVDGANHVLLHGAYRDAKAGGNILIFLPLESSQQKHCACPLRQVQQYLSSGSKIVLSPQDALWVDLFLAVQLRIKSYMQAGPLGGPTPRPVGQNARSCFEDIAPEMFNGFGAVARNN